MAAGLLGYIAGKMAVTAEFGRWRDRDPAGRLVVLLRAWWAYCEWASATADSDAFTVLWRELHVLGLVADGALTPLGRAVLARQWSKAASLLATTMPPAADKALFGADLTAYVAGAPTSAVSALLDSAADREVVAVRWPGGSAREVCVGRWTRAPRPPRCWRIWPRLRRATCRSP